MSREACIRARGVGFHDTGEVAKHLGHASLHRDDALAVSTHSSWHPIAAP